MDAMIHATSPDSIAEALGLLPGARLLALNGDTQLEDLLDYRFHVMGSEWVELLIEHPDGSQEVFDIEKDPDEDLGIHFRSPIFTPIKTCNNACPFCFIDQQPDGLRSSLYVKDDDYRLSYFNNTYITLTNLTSRDRERIERLRPGPFYISVHCTVPELRIQLLVNKKAGNIMDELRWLKSLNIPYHCQVVICPGLNDGDALSQTLSDLATLRPEAESVAVVPVGLTQHRGALPTLRPVDAETAQSVIERVQHFEASHPEHAGFVFLSDEFYFKAGLPLPRYESYGSFPQLDDGVGSSRLLTETFFTLSKNFPAALSMPRNVLIATGRLAAITLHPLAQRLNAIQHLHVDILAVNSQFWGQQVDVAGLITGQDLQAALNQECLSAYEFVVIPSVMLRHGSELFLDGLTLTDLTAAVGLPFRVVQDPTDAAELIHHILS